VCCIGTSKTENSYSHLSCDPAVWRSAKQVNAGKTEEHIDHCSCRTFAQLQLYLAPTHDLIAFVTQCIACSRLFLRRLYLPRYCHPINSQVRHFLVPHRVLIVAHVKHYTRTSTRVVVSDSTSTAKQPLPNDASRRTGRYTPTSLLPLTSYNGEHNQYSDTHESIEMLSTV
jgi:hypothetical protein